MTLVLLFINIKFNHNSFSNGKYVQNRGLYARLVKGFVQEKESKRSQIKHESQKSDSDQKG